jgi:hypothetical protein
MCFDVRTAPQTPRQVFTTNQFEQGAYDIFGVRDLCIPTFVNPGTCGDGAINNAGEECDPGGLNAQCASGVCANDCTCAAPICGDGVINRQDEECEGSPAGCVSQTAVCNDCVCCEPLTCQAGVCGQIDDGCGGTIDCGGCPSPLLCSQNQCCIPSGQPPVGGTCNIDSVGSCCSLRCGDGVCCSDAGESCANGAVCCPLSGLVCNPSTLQCEQVP